MVTNRNYQAYLLESLKDSQEAAVYLDAVLEDGTAEEVRLALKNVAEARIAAAGNGQSVPNSVPNSVVVDPSLTQQSVLEVSTLSSMLDG